MSELFAESEKAALWDLIETHKISVMARGWTHEDGFDACALIQEGPHDYRCVDAHGATAKEAVERLIKEMERELCEPARMF